MNSSKTPSAAYRTARTVNVRVHKLFAPDSRPARGRNGTTKTAARMMEVACLYCLKARGGDISFCSGTNSEKVHNVVLSGIALGDLTGRDFELQGVRFVGRRVLNGAEQGEQSICAQLLSEGWLRPGPAELVIWFGEGAR